MATDGADGEIARSEERPRDDLRPKSGDSLKVHTIKYSGAAAIKAVYHATVSRMPSAALRDGAGRRVTYYVPRRKRRELSWLNTSRGGS